MTMTNLILQSSETTANHTVMPAVKLSTAYFQGSCNQHHRNLQQQQHTRTLHQSSL
jgi:hypothetical protein